MNKSNSGEVPTLAPEIMTRINEGLPRICKAMAELALNRVQAHGLEDVFSSSSRSRGISFSARYSFSASYYDSDAPHYDFYKRLRKEDLESIRQVAKEEDLDEEERKLLESLEAYDSLTEEEKTGGHTGAYFTVQRGNAESGEWYLTHVGAERESRGYCDSSSGPSLPDFETVHIDEDGISARPYNEYEPSSMEALLRMIEIFEKAKEEDIRITLPVTI